MSEYILPNDLERKTPALRQGLALLRNDDLEGALKILASIQLNAGTLDFFKDAYGADWLRQHNFDTTLADQEFGNGWLDR